MAWLNKSAFSSFMSAFILSETPCQLKSALKAFVSFDFSADSTSLRNCSADVGVSLADAIGRPRAMMATFKQTMSNVGFIVFCILTSRAQARGADDVLRDSGTGPAIPRCLQRFVRRHGNHFQSIFNSGV